MWYLKKFDELTVRELHQIYKERVAVFVVEQACPYQEVDELDVKAWHLFEITNGEISSYARIIPEEGSVRIGRVIVPQAFRGGGKARDLMNRAIEICREWFVDQPIQIGAQNYLREFYASLGFVATSGVYLEDDIPHVDMELI